MLMTLVAIGVSLYVRVSSVDVEIENFSESSVSGLVFFGREGRRMEAIKIPRVCQRSSFRVTLANVWNEYLTIGLFDENGRQMSASLFSGRSFWGRSVKFVARDEMFSKPTNQNVNWEKAPGPESVE